jgi:radical SAM superfamily enzyme YgiQ (UPF0313 family)
MKSILLLQPPTHWQRLLRIKSSAPQIWEPLPLLRLAPFLEAGGFRVEILDLRLSGFEVLDRALSEIDPILTGMSIMPGCALPPAVRLTEAVKRRHPSTRVVWGGAFPSLFPELCLQVPGVDIVVRGDGEETLVELASRLRDGGAPGDLLEIAGLAFRRGDQVIRTAPRRPTDLDRFPIGAWHLVDRYMPAYLGSSRQIGVNTARGCPHRCAFCYNGVFHPQPWRYRRKSVAAALEEIDFLAARYSLGSLRFMDDDFLADRGRGVEILSQVKHRHPSIGSHISARTDELIEAGTVGALAASGLRSVFVGAESGSDPELARMAKGTAAASTLEAARLCRTHDVIGTYSFLCGYPGETFLDLQATVKMASAIKAVEPRSVCILEIAAPIPGTSLFSALSGVGLDHTPLDDWFRLSDWKTARCKTWISKPRFYEAFQLAFLLAFTHASIYREGKLRWPTRLASRWARSRIRGALPHSMLEFRLANRFAQHLMWH